MSLRRTRPTRPRPRRTSSSRPRCPSRTAGWRCSNFERGRVAFEKGEIGVGMLWTVESLRMATEAGDEAGRHLALANLSAWRRHLVEPKGIFSHGDVVMSVAFSPDGKTILTGEL